MPDAIVRLSMNQFSWPPSRPRSRSCTKCLLRRRDKGLLLLPRRTQWNSTCCKSVPVLEPAREQHQALFGSFHAIQIFLYPLGYSTALFLTYPLSALSIDCVRCFAWNLPGVGKRGVRCARSHRGSVSRHDLDAFQRRCTRHHLLLPCPH